MADEVLSTAELETLLGRRVVSAADLRRPAMLPFEQPASPLDDALASVLTAIHDRFARQAGAELSAKLRRTARIRLASVRETSAGAFLRRLNQPTCVHLLSAKTAPGQWLLEIEPLILYPMIDCLLGGGRESSPPVRRPPTEIELRLAARLVDLLAGELQAAWQEVAPLTLSVDHPAREPRAVPAADSAEPVVWLTFEVVVGATQGAIQLSLPSVGIARWLGRQESSTAAEEGQPAVGGETIELVACLPELEISDEEAAGLAVGDLIETEHAATAPVQIIHSGAVQFDARLGSLAGRKALEIEADVTDSADAESEQRADVCGQEDEGEIAAEHTEATEI